MIRIAPLRYHFQSDVNSVSIFGMALMFSVAFSIMWLGIELNIFFKVSNVK